ncbi:ribosomal protein S6 kinase alpha-5 [Toxorhynchites rutilus septentrionalis]|uniref:ribosomal protein S6 kinase alpha-5 n=1 Tax=Toxorhynchites rutilus septentrionalis TaxID=329112 RepID=UPI0024798C39|nr:ribosomal protein S6 kinase alpha-5 [Toxorhynchites rutilus septentrionalis]XP_055621627.1 ribosomal protein S6 kinase alpha-5 [Toxorhynchites rutilus septentrionalis]XP_055621629.1 ribosomal protein S6 kinase alpha-5 [Toxorhynchites rutilus septentrionalis]XP_055621630.1 ribosomal protein S6 kinase alpha-5 [Toxorhynchites rutilus septentrionalis]
MSRNRTKGGAAVTSAPKKQHESGFYEEYSSSAPSAAAAHSIMKDLKISASNKSSSSSSSRHHQHHHQHRYYENLKYYQQQPEQKRKGACDSIEPPDLINQIVADQEKKLLQQAAARKKQLEQHSMVSSSSSNSSNNCHNSKYLQVREAAVIIDSEDSDNGGAASGNESASDGEMHPKRLHHPQYQSQTHGNHRVQEEEEYEDEDDEEDGEEEQIPQPKAAQETPKKRGEKRSSSVIYNGTIVDKEGLEMIKISTINTKVKLCENDRVTIDDFKLLKVLGTGAYGKVFLVRKIGGVDHNKLYAMKVLKKSTICQKKKTAEHTKTERQVLESIKTSPFLVTMYYAFQTDSKLHIILDYVSGGELFTHLYNREHFTEDEVRIYIAEIIVALEQLHKLGIIYRDIKLENILIDADGHIVLTDFGLSRELVYENERAHSFCGTIEYMAPEIVKSNQNGHDASVDWWSVGVLTFELLTGSSPFSSEELATQTEISKKITNTEAIIPEHLSREAKDFIRKLLVKDPRRRLGGGSADASELKSHNFFKSINWRLLADKKIAAPFKPVIENELDTNNFSDEFTRQTPVDSPTSAPPNSERLFRGYSYVSPGILSNKVDRNKYAKNKNMRPHEASIRRFVSRSSPFYKKYELLSDHAIGDGIFSTCLKCRPLSGSSTNSNSQKSNNHSSKSQKFAVKVLFNHPEPAAYARQEIETLKACQGHANVVRFVEALKDSNHIYIVLELLDGGELLHRINQNRSFNESQARHYFRQMVQAVAFMHQKGIAHCDLKPENVLFESPNSEHLKLIDFGFAKSIENNNCLVSSPITGTLGYTAPEVFENRSYALESSDLWSLGVILYTMLCGQAPFTPRQFFGHPNLASSAKQMEIITDKIRRGSFDLASSAWVCVSEDAKDIVKSLLTVDPGRRIAMEQLLVHDWLDLSRTAEVHRQLKMVYAQQSLPELEANVRNTYDAFRRAEEEGFRLREVSRGNRKQRRSNGTKSKNSTESQYSSSMEESTSSGIGRSKSSKSSSISDNNQRTASVSSNNSEVVVIDEPEDEDDEDEIELKPTKPAKPTTESNNNDVKKLSSSKVEDEPDEIDDFLVDQILHDVEEVVEEQQAETRRQQARVVEARRSKSCDSETSSSTVPLVYENMSPQPQQEQLPVATEEKDDDEEEKEEEEAEEDDEEVVEFLDLEEAFDHNISSCSEESMVEGLRASIDAEQLELGFDEFIFRGFEESELNDREIPISLSFTINPLGRLRKRRLEQEEIPNRKPKRLRPTVNYVY